MPVFVYEALNQATQTQTEGKLEADTLRAAKDLLRQQGQIPLRVQEETKQMDIRVTLSQLPGVGQLLVPGVSLKALSIFTQQMYVLLDAGIPLIEALFLLEQQTQHKQLKEIIRDMRSAVMAGDSFSAAMSRYPREFPRLYLNMIRAGETSGDIESVCHRLTMLLEKMIHLRGKVTSALFIPAITVLVVIGVLCVIMIVLVPQIKELFSGHGKGLPLPTQILISSSDFMVAAWPFLLVGLCVFGFWFNVFRLGKGKLVVDQWMLTLPVIGDVLRKIYVSRFVRTLGNVFGAGVSLTEAIVTASGTVDNFVLRHAFEKARDSILVGGTMSKPLEQSGAFPPMVVKMIAVGEETGNLEAMLNKAADFLDYEVDRAVELMTSLITPVMTIIVGGIVLAVALAIYIPLFEMGNVMSS